MTTVTESDIKELKELIKASREETKQLIEALREETKERFNSIEMGQVEIKGQIAVVDGRLKAVETTFQKIPDLAEKVGELKNWKQTGLIIITAFISSILSGTIGGVIGWLIRSARF